MLLPLITAGASLLGSAIAGNQSKKQSQRNIAFQNKQNQQQREFELAMALMQRNWSLKDRSHLENYEDPTQQMLRLKAAGLNPHLMYGQGSTGNTEMPRSVNPSVSKLEAPRDTADLPAIIGEALPNAFSSAIATKDLELKEQQRKNLETLNILNDLKAVKTQEDTKTTRFNREYKEQFRDVMYDKILAELENRREDTRLKEISGKVQLSDQQLRNLRYDFDKQKFAWQKIVDRERIAKTRQEVENLQEQKINIIKQQLMNTLKAVGQSEQNKLLAEKFGSATVEQELKRIALKLSERDLDGTPENIERWLGIAEFILGKKRSRF